MPDVRRWSWPYFSAIDCTNRQRVTLPSIPGVAFKVARQVERVATGGSGSDWDDDGPETVDRRKARAHFGDQLVLRDQKKIRTLVLRQAVCQFPLVLGKAALQLPLDRIEGMRTHVVDQRGQCLAIVGKENKAWMRGERPANHLPELTPAAQPAQRVVLRRQFNAESSK